MCESKILKVGHKFVDAHEAGVFEVIETAQKGIQAPDWLLHIGERVAATGKSFFVESVEDFEGRGVPET